MGMIVTYVALNEEQSRAWKEDPAAFFAFLDEDDEGDYAVYDVEKAWHAMHFTLTGSAGETPDPLGQLVLGGEPFTEVMDFGPARMLAADTVRALSEQLEPIDEGSFRARFRPEALDAAGIYPEIWVRDGDVGRDYVAMYYAGLREFLAGAASRGDAVATWIG